MAGTAPTIELSERRRVERRFNARLADLTVAELRRMMITSVLFVIILVLFLWMVRTVIIAGFLGIVVAIFLRPIYLWLLRRIPHRTTAATLAILLLVVPLLGLCAYSYSEIAHVATYVATHQADIVAKIDASVQRLPIFRTTTATTTVGHWVGAASNYGAALPTLIRDTLGSLAIAATIFVFTIFYVIVEWEGITSYIGGKVPPRYSALGETLLVDVRGVLYGAVYSTFLTQGVKSVIILLMNLAFGVPLAVVLAVASFVIGFFPIVGSWSIYVPVAAWLAVFRDSPTAAIAMLAIGFFVNTLYISTFLRPKIAADRSKVLNFYWMLVGLVMGVFTFGLVGILLGPILIGLLKAILDTITEASVSQFTDFDGGDAGEHDASTV